MAYGDLWGSDLIFIYKSSLGFMGGTWVISQLARLKNFSNPGPGQPTRYKSPNYGYKGAEVFLFLPLHIRGFMKRPPVS